MSENKAGILIVSHGNLASSMLETVGMIVGTQNENKLNYVTLDRNDDLKSFEIKFYKKVNEMLKINNKLYILTDIIGGTPNNVAIKYMISNNNIKVISSFNLALILELLDNLDYDIDITKIVQIAKETINEIKISNDFEEGEEECL